VLDQAEERRSWYLDAPPLSGAAFHDREKPVSSAGTHWAEVRLVAFDPNPLHLDESLDDSGDTGRATDPSAVRWGTTLDWGELVELTGYLTVARRWWWTLLVAAWVAALSGWLVASRITPTYEAQVQLLVGPINTDIDTLKASGQLVQTYAQLAISPPLLQSTAREVPGVDPVKLGNGVRATASDVTRVLQIRVQDADPAQAAKIANTMADELIQITTGATTRPEGQLEVIGAAVPPTVPIAPQVSLIVLLAAVAGLLGGLFLVIVVEYATDSVRDRSDLARLVPASVLSTVSFDQRQPGVDPVPVAQAVAPGSENAIAFRLLAAKIAFAATDRPTRSTLVTSLREGDSAVVAMNVAAAMAASGHRVVVVDGSPDGDLTRVLDMTARRGLSDAIGSRQADARGALATGPAGVQVMPSGAEGSLELVAVEHVRAVLDALLREADLVVIDGGAIQQSAGALTWARAAEETVLVVRRGSTRRDELRLAAESLRFVDAAIGGTVLVQRPTGRSAIRRPLGRRIPRPIAAAPESRPIRSGGPTAMASPSEASSIVGGTMPFTPRRTTVAPTISQSTVRQPVYEVPEYDAPVYRQPAYQPPVTIPSIVPSSSRLVSSEERQPDVRPVAPIIPIVPAPAPAPSPVAPSARSTPKRRSAQPKPAASAGETRPADADEYSRPKRRASGRTQRPPAG